MYTQPLAVYMRRKQIGINGSIETTIWSPGIEDDPFPQLLEVLERIARALERITGEE